MKKVCIRVVNPIPQVSRNYITPAGEALNESRMDEALNGADSFFALFGHNAGPYCLVSRAFKKGFTEVPNPEESPLGFGLAVLWMANNFQEERPVMVQEIDRWIKSTKRTKF